jgi:inosose dehydratase
MLVGCGQVGWRRTPEEQVLREVAAAGYDGAPPKLDPPRAAADVVDLYRRHGLRPAPPYFSTPMWEVGRRRATVESARRAARFAREMGCSEMYVAAGGGYRAPAGRSRQQAAATVAPADGLTDREFAVLAETLSDVGRVCLSEGVEACFHQHVGQVVETESELSRLLAATDPGLVFLGPDTGHLAWAGCDPVAFCRRHLDRIRTLHLKDVDCEVRRRGVDAGWDYRSFAANGIFAELGQGCVDFARLLDLLRGHGFDGWLIVETDVPRAPTPAASALHSRRYLRGLGV